MKQKKYKFEAVIIKHPTLNSGYIEFPFDTVKEFGIKGQVKVKAYFDGYAYRGSLVKMGRDRHWIGLTQEVRKAIGKNPGDKVHVLIVQDLEERIVEVPEDFEKALKKSKSSFEYFMSLSYTHKKEYVQWIVEAKKLETRINRIMKAMQMLTEKKKEPR